jgi:hypothetical protein
LKISSICLHCNHSALDNAGIRESGGFALWIFISLVPVVFSTACWCRWTLRCVSRLSPFKAFAFLYLRRVFQAQKTAQQDVQENSAEQDPGMSSSFGLIKTYDGKRRSHWSREALTSSIVNLHRWRHGGFCFSFFLLVELRRRSCRDEDERHEWQEWRRILWDQGS